MKGMCFMVALPYAMLAACAATTPLEKKQNEDRTLSGIVGIAAGAGIGCGAAVLINGKASADEIRKKCISNAKTGAVVGLLAGLALGEVAAQRRAEYEREVIDVNNTGEERRKQLAQLQKELSDTKQSVEQQKTELEAIQSRRKAGRNVTSEAKDYLERVSTQLADGQKAEKEFKAYRDSVQGQMQTIKSGRTASRDEEEKNKKRISELNSEYQQLVQIVREMNGINSSLQTQIAQAKALSGKGV